MGAAMFFRCCASLVLALVVSACASSAGNPLGGGSETASGASRGNSRLIVRAQLEEFGGQSAWDAVDMLNQRWLRPIRSSNSVPAYARVVIDGFSRRELDDLRSISADFVESLRYLSAINATTKYGTGYMGGVIEVTTR